MKAAKKAEEAAEKARDPAAYALKKELGKTLAAKAAVDKAAQDETESESQAGEQKDDGNACFEAKSVAVLLEQHVKQDKKVLCTGLRVTVVQDKGDHVAVKYDYGLKAPGKGEAYIPRHKLGKAAPSVEEGM